MLASPRNSGRQGGPVAKSSGFTLVELLTVIAIIMILAGIVVGVQRGVYSSQANAKARAEIQTIATALERYKAAHGTYPRVSATSATTAQDLYDRLTGAVYDKYNNGSWQTESVAEANRRPLIDASTMTVNNRAATTGLHFVDPWGTPYVYIYTNTTENAAGDFFFILYSKGPNKTPANAVSDVARFGSASAYFNSDETRDDIVYGLEYNP